MDITELTPDEIDKAKSFVHECSIKRHRRQGEGNTNRLGVMVYDQQLVKDIKDWAQINNTDITSVVHNLLTILHSHLVVMNAPSKEQQSIKSFISNDTPMKPPRLDATTSEILEYLSTIKTVEQYDTDVERPLRALIRACSMRHEEITRDAVWRE